MFTFYCVIIGLIYATLVAFAGIHVTRSRSSTYELERRARAGDNRAANILRRERLVDASRSVLRLSVTMLLVLFVAISIMAFGWLIGMTVATIGALGYGALGSTSLVMDSANPFYEKRLEPGLLTFLERHPGIGRVLRVVPLEQRQELRIESQDELLHLIRHTTGIISSDNKKLIENGLRFGEMYVSEYMTPRSVIDSIKNTEVLGPLSLDELHKTGHSRFPVIDGDIDHVVGMIYIHDLLTLRDKTSPRAKEIMSTQVYYINEGQTLRHALAAFLHMHHHLFIVVNEYRETVGILTLEDTVEALLGRKIVDEFDAHEDLRKVAERNPRKNNVPLGQNTV